MSDFLNRLAIKNMVGRIVKSNNQWISLPLIQHRPPYPFEPRLTAEEKKWVLSRFLKYPKKYKVPSKFQPVHPKAYWYVEYIKEQKEKLQDIK